MNIVTQLNRLGQSADLRKLLDAANRRLREFSVQCKYQGRTAILCDDGLSSQFWHVELELQDYIVSGDTFGEAVENWKCSLAVEEDPDRYLDIIKLDNFTICSGIEEGYEYNSEGGVVWVGDYYMKPLDRSLVRIAFTEINHAQSQNH